MKLRDYQHSAVNSTIIALNEYDRALLLAPTGSGKTIIFSAITAELVKQGKRVLLLAHREELIDQNIDKLYRSTGIFAGKEKAEFRARLTDRVVAGSVQTLMGQ